MMDFCRKYGFSRAAASLLVLAVLSRAYAATLAGVDFPEQAVVSGKTLALNGLGLRTATMLKVKVYVIALYLESKSGDAKAIIESPQSKRIAMHFVHDVAADELKDAWSEGFENNYKDVGSIKGEIEKFNAGMRDVKKGDTIVLDFHDDTVDVIVKDATTVTVQGPNFQQAVLSIWLGDKPPNDELKTGILGQ
jgi:hypothetical protein